MLLASGRYIKQQTRLLVCHLEMSWVDILPSHHFIKISIVHHVHTVSRIQGRIPKWELLVHFSSVRTQLTSYATWDTPVIYVLQHLWLFKTILIHWGGGGCGASDLNIFSRVNRKLRQLRQCIDTSSELCAHFLTSVHSLLSQIHSKSYLQYIANVDKIRK